MSAGEGVAPSPEPVLSEDSNRSGIKVDQVPVKTLTALTLVLAVAENFSPG